MRVRVVTCGSLDDIQTKFLFKWLFQQNFPFPRISPLLQILFSFAELYYKSTVQFNLMPKLDGIFLSAVFSDVYRINKCILFVLANCSCITHISNGIAKFHRNYWWKHALIRTPLGTHCTFILNKTKCTDGIVGKCKHYAGVRIITAATGALLARRSTSYIVIKIP